MKISQQQANVTVELCHDKQHSSNSNVSTVAFFSNRTETPQCNDIPDQRIAVDSLPPGQCTRIAMNRSVPWGEHTAWVVVEESCRSSAFSPDWIRSLSYQALPDADDTVQQVWIELDRFLSDLYTAMIAQQGGPLVEIHTLADIFDKTTQKQRQQIADSLAAADGALLYAVGNAEIHFTNSDNGEKIAQLSVQLDEGDEFLTVDQAIEKGQQQLPTSGSLYLELPGNKRFQIAAYHSDNLFDCQQIQPTFRGGNELFIMKKAICLYNQHKSGSYEEPLTAFLQSPTVEDMSIISGFQFVGGRLVIDPIDPQYIPLMDIDLSDHDWSQQETPTNRKQQYTQGLYNAQNQYAHSAIRGHIVHLSPNPHLSIAMRRGYDLASIRAVTRQLIEKGTANRLLITQLLEAVWPGTATPSAPSQQTSPVPFSAVPIPNGLAYYVQTGQTQRAVTPLGKTVGVWSVRFTDEDPVSIYDNTLSHAVRLFPGYTIETLAGPNVAPNYDYMEPLAEALASDSDMHTLFINAHGNNGRFLIGAYGPMPSLQVQGIFVAQQYHEILGEELGFGDTRYAKFVSAQSNTQMWGAISPMAQVYLTWTRALQVFIEEGDTRGVVFANMEQAQLAPTGGFAHYENDPDDESDDVNQGWAMNLAIRLALTASDCCDNTFDPYDLNLLADYVTGGQSLAYVLDPYQSYLDTALENWSNEADIMLNESGSSNYAVLQDSAWTDPDGSRIVSWRQMTNFDSGMEGFPRILDIGPYEPILPADTWGEWGEKHKTLAIQFSSHVQTSPIAVESIAPDQPSSPPTNGITVHVPTQCGAPSDVVATWTHEISNRPALEIDGTVYDSELLIELTNASELVYYWRYSTNYGLPSESPRPGCVREDNQQAIDALQAIGK